MATTDTTATGKILGGDGCRWHPSPTLVASYVAGQLACAEAVAIATHLALCPACAAVHRNIVGTVATDVAAATPVEDAPAFNRCLVRAKIAARREAKAARLDLPESVRTLLGKYVSVTARWWPIYRGVKRMRLKIRSPHQDSYDASLIRVKAGAYFPQHAHDDIEYMVVLQGTMIDEHGTYPQGSFLTTRAGEVHTPRAGVDGDVLCLNVARGTVRFTDSWLRVLNPLLKRTTSATTV